MSERSDLAEVGPWAEQKLSALSAYLDFYTKVLKNQPWRTIYVDAFAGGGSASIRKSSNEPSPDALFFDEVPPPEQTRIIDGSPRRALELQNPFSTYVFVDANQRRIGQLNALCAEFSGSRNIHVREGCADDQIEWLLQQNISKRTHRGVAFLDPFGAHLSWKSVRSLAETGVFEAIINFPLHMCINRLATRDPDIRPEFRAPLDAFFPGGWYDEAYETSGGLFGNVIAKRPDAPQRLLAFYQKNLESAFGHVSQAMMVRNTRGSPLYYLIWAGPHSKGLVGADAVLRTGERLPRNI